ncbi:MAG: hypothetical protein KIB01_06165 [Negativicoccus succinicivorans]|uniref:Ribosomal protein L14E n=1 Tax=Negativicoccus succinicivorans DORA_17_25 TaxID=1403945 RepID=W1U0B0_9FIRM|nr:KOW domain-containing RNA-binding protein [Negativicoccus succinicivorans]ETI86069.1 MAG: Ribosomal protein L14E [Negativicoccus succinicivorans DORA_17_25]MBS5917921.1 hypothetical protein [Negativicoccus succinicivorans]MDU0826118.1 KOW domain-containing RNA-binding protein [Negativicoccus succinicivorans]MDU2183403.1 KOW domain-containing RNA-binding protein [Negativicoccus succinicivorans]MDU2643704.1 KOW domain-containing RNA-binding protein [Negativicoccus succinicivorans]
MTETRPLSPGTIVEATAGRERGQWFVVLRCHDASYVELADGRKRPVAQPKTKNRRHVRIRVAADSDAVYRRTHPHSPWRDEEIRAAITQAKAALQKGGFDEQGRCH